MNQSPVPPRAGSSSDSVVTKKSSRLERAAFALFMCAIIVAPIATSFTPYVTPDASKSLVISLGVLLSAILYLIVAFKERSVVLPPKGISWSAALVAVSLIISSLTSTHAAKSLFGQGFELTTVSFVLTLMAALWVGYTAVHRRPERASLIFLGIMAPFIVLVILHISRFIIGPSFMSLGVLSTLTTTLVGSWYDLAVYAGIVTLLAISARAWLPLGKRVSLLYWAVAIVGLIVTFIINSSLVWVAICVVFALMSLGSVMWNYSSFRSRCAALIRWPVNLFVVMFLLSGAMAVWGTSLADPFIKSLNASYGTISLPWQLTLDVDADVIKQAPVFGIGPNHFSQAYIAYKPTVINQTYAWNAEFSHAWSLLTTFVATQGLFGTLAWILFLIAVIRVSVRGTRHVSTSTDAYARFVTYAGASVVVFTWIIHACSVSSHTILLYTFVVTGLAVAACSHSGSCSALEISPSSSTRSKIMSALLVGCTVIGIVWAVIVVKNTVALHYFGSGIKSLTIANNSVAADEAFARAYWLNTSDVYLQARAEAGIARATALMGTISSTMSASSSQDVINQVFQTINTSVKYAQAAIAYDPSNYYNYLSEARVSELATSVRMDKAYDNTIASYVAAIQRNPYNPSLYLTMAQFQISQNKLDDAVRTLGAALQVKSDYLDAIFILSQVAAARGNLRDAITAAQVAVQLNPQNPLYFFQLGLLRYNNKEYAAAAEALQMAVQLRADYANARYFLGLSYARLNETARATEQFEYLATTNPDNQEVLFILTNLQSGRSPFADAKPPVTPTPEKRKTLPIKEKKK